MTDHRSLDFDLTRILAEIGREGCKCGQGVVLGIPGVPICRIHELVFKARETVNKMADEIMRARRYGT